jgi:hypothetical protein
MLVRLKTACIFAPHLINPYRLRGKIMANLLEPVKKGLKKSLQLLWMLTKIILPVSCMVAVLDYYGIINSIAGFFAPFMSLFGLPGEATIALAA